MLMKTKYNLHFQYGKGENLKIPKGAVVSERKNKSGDYKIIWWKGISKFDAALLKRYEIGAQLKDIEFTDDKPMNRMLVKLVKLLEGVK